MNFRNSLLSSILTIHLLTTVATAQETRELSLDWLRRVQSGIERELKTSTPDLLLNLHEPSDASSSIVRQLLLLDHPSIRKQHLTEVVGLCEKMLERLEQKRWRSSKSQAGIVEAEDPNHGIRIELLYRKGRALGYMELPDVVVESPVRDPVRLNRRFEKNFSELASLTNTTHPQFILLRIRRERRRGEFFEALRLVELYRKTHPSPTWYRKKRQDILYEMGLVSERYLPAPGSMP